MKSYTWVIGWLVWRWWVAFFFLLSVVHSIFSLFVCIPLDKPVEPPCEATAVGTFWMHDTEQPCYQGYHKVWSLALGVPWVVLVVLGLPAGGALLMICNRHRLADVSFRRHYGFLFRFYKLRQYCYWESGVMLCTIISLVATSIFGLIKLMSLGPFERRILPGSRHE